MNNLRWHAVLQQWVVVSTNRQGRPQMPANWCPFCPGSGNVPEKYDVYLYPNDFPAFSLDNQPLVENHDLFGTAGAYGACDVVLYSPQHTLPPSKLSIESWTKVVQLWTQRTAELSKDPGIAVVAAFENCGEAVGVTMPHPHGQIYAMPFVPFLTERELQSASQYAKEHQNGCIFCDLLELELKDTSRLIEENDSFVAFVPFAARFPAEIAIYPRRHVRTLLELTAEEQSSLASLISIVRKKYDGLYGFLLPLMMTVNQAPLQQPDAAYHLHISFLPLQRSATKLKYLASIETGFGTFLADTSPEQMAENLRQVSIS